MYHTIVIINQEKNNEEEIKKIFFDMDFIIISNYELIKPYMLISNNEMIEFDYLIFSSFNPLLDVLMENEYVITNKYFETSVDNYFSFGKIVRSLLSHQEQLETILNYIKNKE